MGFFNLFRGNADEQRTTGSNAARPTGLPAPASGPEVDLDELIEAVRQRLLPGFMDAGEIAELVADEFELDFGDCRVAGAVRQAWIERKEEESNWPEGSSDFEKLAAAFAELNRTGTLAKMNFTCCNTCGTDEIGDHRTPVAVRANEYGFAESQYVFFHQQDAERLADDHATLYLTYSSWRPSADTDPALLAAAREGDEEARREVAAFSDAQVGVRIVEVLRAHGLSVGWNGDPAHRIEVAVERWRKPLASLPV